MQKKLILFLCIALACMPVFAFAEGTSAIILPGKVEAKDTITVYSPMGGTVEDFTLRAGDRVTEGMPLVTIETVKVYAPCDGVVRGIFAQPGDMASFVQSRYGALCYIEPDARYSVQSATTQGYDSLENRFLHIGEAVYLQGATAQDRSGEGRIIAVDGDNYTVEVLSGSLELRDTANIFRDASFGSDTRIGRGTVSRVNPVGVTGDGAVLKVIATDGMRVRRGDLLMEMATGTLDALEAVDETVRSPVDGVVASVLVTAGQSISKGSAVASLYGVERMQLVSSVSELDAGSIALGDAVRITFDSLPGIFFNGTIDGISEVGTQSENYTEYAVYIDFIPDETIRFGMSGTAYPQGK